jgi:carbon storage regulator
MLVVSRRKGDRILIGNQIEIVVVEITPRGVRLGIRAPVSVTVLRGELVPHDPPPAPPRK